jgi:hypothetical protein
MRGGSHTGEVGEERRERAGASVSGPAGGWGLATEREREREKKGERVTGGAPDCKWV